MKGDESPGDWDHVQGKKKRAASSQHLVSRWGGGGKSNKHLQCAKQHKEEEQQPGRILHSVWVSVSQGWRGGGGWCLRSNVIGKLYRVLYKAGGGGGAVFKRWDREGGRGPVRLHYLLTGRCSPLRGLSGWGRGGRSSSWASREKWSEGMWGWGQPVMLLSVSHWLSRGPRSPRTLMWFFEKKM